METKNYFRGFPLVSAAKLANVEYSTVWRHFSGKRKITAEYALRYHKALGIPLSELRPDLWPPEPEKDDTPPAPTTTSQGEANGTDK